MTRDQIRSDIIEAGMDAANDAAHAGKPDHDQLVAGIRGALARLAEIAEAEGVKAMPEAPLPEMEDEGGAALEDDCDVHDIWATMHDASPCWLRSIAKGGANA